MKIAILPLGHRKLPSDGATIFAPGVLAYRAAEELTSNGHEVDIYAPKGSEVNANVIDLGLESMFGLFSEKKSSDPGQYFQTLMQYELYLASYLIENSGKYDIIHAHDYRKLMYLSHFSKCPIVYSYHGNPMDDANLEIDKKRFQKYYSNNFFIAASKRQSELGGDYLNFVDVVPHGVDPEKIPFSDVGSDELLYVGRLMKRKRPDIALKIARDLGKEIIVIGSQYPTPEDAEYYEKLQSLLSEDRVKNLGLLQFDEVYKHLSSAKALLLPIEWEEPFGMVMIEAMAAGTPVVAFNLGSVSEVIEDGVTGFTIEPGDYQGMLEKVQSIYSMPLEDYKQMRINCRNRVLEKYTTKKMVEGFEKVYKKIINV